MRINKINNFVNLNFKRSLNNKAVSNYRNSTTLDSASFKNTRKADSTKVNYESIRSSYLSHDDKKLNKLLGQLSPKDLANAVQILNTDYKILPLARMNDENIEKLRESLDGESYKKLVQFSNRAGENVYQAASAERLEKICEGFDTQEILKGAMQHNITGTNAFHFSMNDAKKAAFLCKRLDKQDILRALMIYDGYGQNVLFDSNDEVKRIYIEKITPNDLSKLLAVDLNDEGNNLLHTTEDAATVELFCSRLETQDFIKLCKQQNNYGNTPLHTQNRRNIEVIEKHLPEEVFSEILDTQNAYQISARETLRTK